MTNIEKLYIKKLKEYIIKVDYIIGNHEMSNMILTRIRRQIASLEQQMIEEQKNVSDNKDAEIKKLIFMIDNGLGWEDMQNDITMPHEL